MSDGSDKQFVLRSSDATKLQDLVQRSSLIDEDKQWWMKKIPTLSQRQAKQLWRIFHAKTGELDQIIHEEEALQIKLKEDLDKLVREGTATIYKMAEKEEERLDNNAADKLLEDNEILDNISGKNIADGEIVSD